RARVKARELKIFALSYCALKAEDSCDTRVQPILVKPFVYSAADIHSAQVYRPGSYKRRRKAVAGPGPAKFHLRSAAQVINAPCTDRLYGECIQPQRCQNQPGIPGLNIYRLERSRVIVIAKIAKHANLISRQYLKPDLEDHRRLQIDGHLRLHRDDDEAARRSETHCRRQCTVQVVSPLSLVVEPEADLFRRPVIHSDACARRTPVRDIEPILTGNTKRGQPWIRL